MVYRRLYEFIEEGNHLPEYQSGFRTNHSTLDHLITVQQEALSAFSRKESLVMVMLDVKKAYDSVWRAGLLEKLRSVGVSGRMFSWLQAFLKSRRSRVAFQQQISEWRHTQFGVPQGSPLSPLLFNVFVASVFSKVSIRKTLFADDMAVFVTGKDIKTLSKNISKQLRAVSSWARRWRVEFNVQKCCSTLLTRVRSAPDPTIYFQGELLSFNATPKYLGMTFDRQLRWKPHLENIHQSATRTFDFLDRIASTQTKISQKTLLNIYKSCARPKLEYACQIWNDASDQLKYRLIDSLQHSVLTRIFRVTRSTGTEALQVETSIPPLELRRQYLTARAYVRCKRAGTAVTKELVKHEQKLLDQLHSPLNSSFFQRGEKLLSSSFASGDLETDYIRLWQDHWTASSRARLFFKYQPKVSLKRHAWQSHIQDKHVSLLAGIRLNTPPLNKYRFQIGISESPMCECGKEEDVDHVFLHCPKYSVSRAGLFKSFLEIYPNLCRMNCERLFDFELPSRKLKLKLKALVKFLTSIKRFK